MEIELSNSKSSEVSDETIEIPEEKALKPPEKAPPKQIRIDIQILRAISIILVLLYHLGVPRVKGGFIGVDIFFVISGYLVMGAFIQQSTKDYEKLKYFKAYVSFIARRIKRLTLASAVCLLAVLIGVYVSPMKVPHGLESVRYAALNYINIWLWSISGWYGNDTSQNNVVLHFWSLAVEWQFYFAFPVVLLGLMLICRLANVSQNVFQILTFVSCFIATTASFGLCFTGTPSTKFYLLHTRIWEFVVGALVNLSEETFEKHVIRYFEDKTSVGVVDYGLKAIVCTLFCALSVGGYFIPLEGWPGPWSLYVVGLTVISILLQRKFSKNILTRPLVLIGDWSYSIYLYHWPIIVFAKIYILATSEGVSDPFFWGACLFLTFCAALVSYYVVERMSGWIESVGCLEKKNWELFWIGVFATTLVLIPCLTLIPLRTYPLPPPVIANVTFDLNPNPTPEERKALIQAVWDMENSPSVWFNFTDGYTSTNPERRNVELVFSRNPKRCMLTLGDSHSQQFHVPWNYTAEKYNASYYRMNRPCMYPEPICYPDKIINSIPVPSALDGCESLLVLIGMWHYNYQDALLAGWQDSFVRVANEYSKKGQVLIYRDFEWDIDPSYLPPTCVKDNAVEGKDLTICHKTHDHVTYPTPKYDKVIQTLSDNENVGNLWLLPYITTSDHLVYAYNYDYPLFQDTHHLTQDFAKRFAPSFVQVLENTTVVQKFIKGFSK